jgi:hypothetical protein
MNDPASWLGRRRAKPPNPWLSASDHPAFRDQFVACDQLEEFVMQSISNPSGSYNNSENAIVKLAVSRALHAFDALLCLAEGGYGAPALALARTLVEEAVASWWLRTLPKERAVELLQSHEQSYSLMLQGPGTPSVTYLPLLRDLAPMSAEDVEAARSQFAVDPRLGRSHWTRKTVNKMASSVQDGMRPVERETLRTLIGKPLLIANLMTHNSPLSMAARLAPVEVGSALPERQTSRRPSTALIHEALAVAYESLALIAWLVRNEGDATVVDDLIRQGRYEFVVLESADEPGRNEPCPCGSFKKYKRCHGAPGKRESRPTRRERGWTS